MNPALTRQGGGQEVAGKVSPVDAGPPGQPVPNADAGQPSQDSKRPEAPSPAELEKSVDAAVERINEFVQVVQRDLQFTVDDSTGRTVVKVMDSQSEEVIRQLPPEEILAVAAHMEEVRGLLVKEKA
ncbi:MULTISPECIES: flagellar protein FlaG [unclassified Ectothiorhodospira]|uniref:flagellar protein FlaG n=1 Tax=unclassified Ectothiorhodospira TaxID=2684909 RepID=UPI001EE91908|nr:MULTISPECIES: flagellar protein FlaG [unclassified Ectothiorhodospira]MCG5516527.1 flagellar protein FlaG [Ectothiorhodospira sp. 9100]MCG5519274.1 flagellar protein FlaG [Ectothiorhodospira sp. 9905]